MNIMDFLLGMLCGFIATIIGILILIFVLGEDEE